jgi:hypothetical protein
MEWTADICNDPKRDFDLSVDIQEGTAIRATIFRNSAGDVVLRVYPAASIVDIPGSWLRGILARAENDLPKAGRT